MRNKITAILTAALLLMPIPAQAMYSDLCFDIAWEEQGFQKMHTTAYMIQGVTASGIYTHPGICACNTHLGEVAVVYSRDGRYLGTFECIDTGITDGLKAGTVIDVWFETYDECKEWMTVSRGKCYVKWIKGQG